MAEFWEVAASLAVVVDLPDEEARRRARELVEAFLARGWVYVGREAIRAGRHTNDVSTLEREQAREVVAQTARWELPPAMIEERDHEQHFIGLTAEGQAQVKAGALSDALDQLHAQRGERRA